MEKPQRHPLEYDEEPLPLLLRPLSWVLYAICAALVPVKIVLLAVVGCVGVVLSDLLPRRRAGAPLQLVIRCGMALFGVWPGCLRVVDLRTAEDYETPAPIVALAPHCGMLEGFFAAYYFWARAVVVAGVRGEPRGGHRRGEPRGPQVMAPYVKIPLVRSMAKGNDAIVVKLKRHDAPASPGQVAPADGERAKPSGGAREAILAHANAYAGGQPCFLLPEGTTHNGKQLLTYFTGAFGPGAPIQPVVVAYPHRYLDAASFCGGLPAHLLRQLLSLYVRMEVTVLPVYRPSDDEKADAALYAANVRGAMAAAASLPLSTYGAKQLNEEYYGKKPKPPDG